MLKETRVTQFRNYMKTLTIRNIIRWCLAFLCFGLVGIKISNAQIIGSSGCNFGYASAFMSLTLGAENANGNIYEKFSGSYRDYWGEYNDGVSYGYNISNTFSAVEPDWSGSVVSLSDTANAANSLQWGIYHYDSSGAPAGFTYTIDSVSVTGHAIGGGTLSFDLLIGGVSITNGASLGSTFSGYLDYGSDPYTNNNFIELRPYDNGTNVMEFQIDSINVGIIAYANGGTDHYNLCTGAITPVPEASVTLLGGIAALALVTRRRRA